MALPKFPGISRSEHPTAIVLQPERRLTDDEMRTIHCFLNRAPEIMVLPPEMTPAIKDALGTPNFQAGPLAHALRGAGVPIENRYEGEQAHVLFMFLKAAITHGDQWRQEISRQIAVILDGAKAEGKH